MGKERLAGHLDEELRDFFRDRSKARGHAACEQGDGKSGGVLTHANEMPSEGRGFGRLPCVNRFKPMARITETKSRSEIPRMSWSEEGYVTPSTPRQIA